MAQILWQPTREQIAAANMTAFMKNAAATWRIDLPDYAALHRWSVTRPEQFWQSVWDDCRVIASAPWQQVLVHPTKMPGAKWFTGARFNFAENLLRFRDDRPALVSWNESGRMETVSYADLLIRVASLAAALRQQGVAIGDRVAAMLPNRIETVVAMLAATSIGAIWSSCSPEFGIKAAVDRFGQIEPKILFATDGYEYNGQTHRCLDKVHQIASQLSQLQRTIVVPQLDPAGDLSPLRRAAWWSDFIGTVGANEPHFEQLPFDHPVYILYSSGTTGQPKCIVHGAGGTLIQHLKELVLHTDLRRDDRILYFTTCGWMMWNWLISALAVGAQVVLYDGSPVFPQPTRLFELAEREQLTVLGTSARYLDGVAQADAAPAEMYDLSRLRTILSTGSPLAATSFDYVYRSVKSDVQLSSISGGTDIVSCFVLGCPITPVYRGELQVRGLGMQVEVFDDAGHCVRGKKGELVCTAPFPSMPLGFWGDAEDRKYLATYFTRFPGVWHHGDYAELTDHEGLIIHGRSDAVLNPGGIRIGTAEIYRTIQHLPEIVESVVVGQQWAGDTRILLFVKLQSATQLDDTLSDRIKQQIREHASPRHVPAKIIQVADIPRTFSGKTVELAVRDVIHGRPVRNREALANPESLRLFENLPDLQ